MCVHCNILITTTELLEVLSVILFMFIIKFETKSKHDAHFNSLVQNNADACASSNSAYPFDGWPVIAGNVALLKIFHASYVKSVLLHIGLNARYILCLDDQL